MKFREYEKGSEKTSVLFEKIWKNPEAGCWDPDSCFWILVPGFPVEAMCNEYATVLLCAWVVSESGLHFIGGVSSIAHRSLVHY
jgi:hypothetical protein